MGMMRPIFHMLEIRTAVHDVEHTFSEVYFMGFFVWMAFIALQSICLVQTSSALTIITADLVVVPSSSA